MPAPLVSMAIDDLSSDTELVSKSGDIGENASTPHREN
jgi:hypothetical protein